MMQTAKRGNIIDLLCFFSRHKLQHGRLKKEGSGLKFNWNLLPCEPQTCSNDPSQALMDI